MNIKLPADQQQWLEQQVAAGRYGSVDDAITAAVADLMATEGDDLAWAKGYVDAARKEAERGEVVALNDALADMDSYLASLKRDGTG